MILLAHWFGRAPLCPEAGLWHIPDPVVRWAATRRDGSAPRPLP